MRRLVQQKIVRITLSARAAPTRAAWLQEGEAFIRDVISNLEAAKQPDTQQPILYLRMQLAQYALVQGRLQVRAARARVWQARGGVPRGAAVRSK